MAGPTVADFGSTSPLPRVPSGAHYPRQAATVEAWANWYDAAGPSSARVNLDGGCVPMTRRRGTASNGAWAATLGGVGTGCHRYVFEFRAADGTPVAYPTTGSLGIGGAGCADWDPARPPPCPAGCN
jgi:hypothetical protein